MNKFVIIFLVISLKIFSFTISDTLDIPDSMNAGTTEFAGAKEDMSTYSEQYEHSIKNVDIELQKLRGLPAIDGEMINIINVKSIIDTSDYAIEQEILSEDENIVKLRNYLSNSADEYKIQKIKRVLNARSVKPEDIVSVYVKSGGGINLYYYKKK